MADLGSPWVWKIPWRREWLPVPVFWPHLLVYQDDRVEGTLEGHKQILVCTRTQEKGAVTPQEIESDLPVTVQESPGRCGSAAACCRVGALSVAVHARDLWKEVTIIFISSTIVWPQVNNRKGTQPCPSTENWIKDLLSMALPNRTRPRFPYSQSLPSGSFHKPLIFIHQREDKMKSTTTEN